MAKRYNVCDSIWTADELSIAACTSGNDSTVVGNVAFRVSGITLVGVKRTRQRHDMAVKREIPNVLDAYMCVQPYDDGWYIDYRMLIPTHTSHSIASAASYLYVNAQGVEQRVRWNIPFMTPDPFYVFRDMLRVWIGDIYYEVPSGTLVSLGPLFCEALIERGPWAPPYRVRRMMMECFRAHNVAAALERLVADYLYDLKIVAQTECYVGSGGGDDNNGLEEPPIDTRVAAHVHLTVSCSSIGSMSFGRSSTLLDMSLTTKYDIPEMLRPLTSTPNASTKKSTLLTSASVVTTNPDSSPSKHTSPAKHTSSSHLPELELLNVVDSGGSTTLSVFSGKGLGPVAAIGCSSEGTAECISTPTQKRKSVETVAYSTPTQSLRSSTFGGGGGGSKLLDARSAVSTTTPTTRLLEMSWLCDACTFINRLRLTSCEMCETVKTAKRAKP
jgi:hypothetical protein